MGETEISDARIIIKEEEESSNSPAKMNTTTAEFLEEGALGALRQNDKSMKDQALEDWVEADIGDDDGDENDAGEYDCVKPPLCKNGSDRELRDITIITMTTSSHRNNDEESTFVSDSLRRDYRNASITSRRTILPLADPVTNSNRMSVSTWQRQFIRKLAISMFILNGIAGFIALILFWRQRIRSSEN